MTRPSSTDQPERASTGTGDSSLHAGSTPASGSIPLSSKERLDVLRSICAFAFEHGYHELGYDPVQALADEIGQLEYDLEMAHGPSGPPRRAPETRAPHPYLLNATRFKLSFNRSGYTGTLCNFARELDGRWVALVAAEDDAHMRGYSTGALATFVHAAPSEREDIGRRVAASVDEMRGDAVKTSGPLCPDCKTELAFEGDVCGLCNPVSQP